MKNYIYIAIIMMLFFSCKKDNEVDTLKRYTFDKTVDYPLDSIPPYKNVSIVPLQTNDSSLLKDILSIKVSNDIILVRDRYRLLLFNWNGLFITQVGIKGGGPGEYQWISSYYIDDASKTINIFDSSKSEILKYNYSGIYVSSTKLENLESTGVKDICLLNNGNLLISHSINDVSNTAISHFDGKNINYCLSYSPLTIEGYQYTFSYNQISCYKNRINILMPFCDTIFSFSDNRVGPDYTIEIPGEMVSREAFKEGGNLSFHENMNNQNKKGKFPGFVDLFETDDYILLNYLYKGYASGFFLGDKHSKEGKYYLHCYPPKTDKVPFFGRVVETYKNCFISYMNPHSLITLRETFMDDSKDESLQKLIKLIDGLKDDDNPVLFIYKFSLVSR